jgi:archaellum biogenesis ATPase FlaH
MKLLTDIDRPLPHSSEAERAFLGAILLGAPASELDRLDVIDFFIPCHRVICSHLKRLKDQGKPTDDSVLLYESLAGDDKIEEAGGLSYISQLADGLPRLSNLTHYAQIINDKSKVRELLYTMESSREKLLAANGNAGQLLQEVTRRFESCFTPRVEVESNRMRFKTAADEPTYDQTEWIAKGLVPKGAITSINARIKLGKTAFILAMCRAVMEGLDFLGEPTSKTNVVYLTEQSASSFDRAIDTACLRGRVGFTYLPFTETCGKTWTDVAAHVAKVCKETRASLLVIDTLSQFAGMAGDSENDAGAAQAAMLPLQKIAAEGIAVVIVRHARKSGGDVEDAGRGSSAFDGAADLILSLRKPDGNQPENRRLLNSSGRYSGETHNNLLIEMTDGGFVAIGNQQETAINDAKETIMATAPRSEIEAATLAEIAEATKIAKITVQRACDELVKSGALNRTGKGKKGGPFLHWVEEIRFDSTSPIEVEPDSNPKTIREPGDEAAHIG